MSIGASCRSPTCWVLAGLAVAFQILATPSIGGNPIRLALADLMLPLLTLLASWQWTTGARPWPIWRLSRLYAWLAAIGLWLTVALVIGRLHIGGWEKWALINKYAGWYVLIAFLLAGAWAGQTTRGADTRMFIRVFLAWAAIVAVVDIGWYVLLQSQGIITYARAEGWAGNPNSYGYLLAVVMVVSLAAATRGPILGARLDLAALGMVGCGLFFSGSRSAAVGLACGIALLAVIRWLPVAQTVRVLAITAMFSASASVLPDVIHAGRNMLAHGHVAGANGPFTPYSLRENIIADSGVSHRLRIIQAAIALWTEQPVVGVGLGSFFWNEQRRGEQNPATIHNTALWLLTETGIVGLSLFTAFCLAVGHALWRAHSRGELDPLAIGGFAALAVMVGASVGMESLYQRHVWFLVGYALLARKPTDSEPA